MGQRSTLRNSLRVDLGSDPCDGFFHSDHPFFTRNASDFTNRTSYPISSAPWNTMNHVHQSRDYHGRLMFYRNDYINYQNRQAIQNSGLGASGPNLYNNSGILLSPPGRICRVHQSDMMTEQLTSSICQTNNGCEISWHNQFFDSGLSCKRKNLAMIPGNYYSFHGPTSSSLSTSFVVPQWGQSYESSPHVTDTNNFAISAYDGTTALLGTDTSHRIATSIQTESTFPTHQNCLPPGSYMMQTLQPSGYAWDPQLGNGANIGEGSSTWNQKNTVRYLQGPWEVAPVNMQACAGSFSGTNSALLFHQSSMPNFHPPIQNVHAQSYRPHANMPASSLRTINDLNSINSRRTGDGVNASATFPHFPSGIDQIFPSNIDELHRYGQLLRQFNNNSDELHRYGQLLRRFNNSSDELHRYGQLLQQSSNGNLIFPSTEDATPMEFSELYGTGNAIDQHQDMRLDIDDMSYEELLALEERIGVVKTGLPEEFIARNLKTRVCVSKEAASSSQLSFKSSMDNVDCAVCQVEYEENDMIGTIECGHSYHVECIKQWLLIKNLCPICKASALMMQSR